jgi:hypothetical protein
VITIILKDDRDTYKLEVRRETPKAVLLAGKCSQAWFPRAAIAEDGTVADWFKNRMTIAHGFLFTHPLA